MIPSVCRQVLAWAFCVIVFCMQPLHAADPNTIDVQVLQQDPTGVSEGNRLKMQITPSRPQFPIRVDSPSSYTPTMAPSVYTGVTDPFSITSSAWAAPGTSPDYRLPSPYAPDGPLYPQYGSAFPYYPTTSVPNVGIYGSSPLPYMNMAQWSGPPPLGGLNDGERAELEMWRRLASNPIYVTLQGHEAYVEWNGAASRIPIPPNGKIQIRLSPMR